MHEDDLLLREALKDLAPVVGDNGVWASLQSRVAAKRRANRQRLVFAGAAVAVAACLGFGAYGISQWWPRQAHILVITDETIPGSTGQTTQTTAVTPGATFRGNIERTGVFPAGGPSELPELLWKFGGGGDAVVSDGLVFVGSGDYLHALDIQTGNEKWEFRGAGTAPTVAGGAVYAGSSDYLYALDIQTGQEMWRFGTGGEVRYSPAVSDGVLYFGSLNGYFYAVDTESGEEKWKVETTGVVPFSSAVSEGVVYFSSDDSGYDSCYAVDAQGGQVMWKVKVDGLGQVVASPAVSGGAVYFVGNNGLYALDIQSGQEKWAFWTGAGDQSGSSPAVTGGMVYFGGRDGYLYAVDVATGQEKWKFFAGLIPNWGPEGVFSSPSISGGVLYIGAGYTFGNNGKQDEPGPGLCALDIATGKELWRFRTGDVVMSSPTISDGVVYFGSNDGYLYALK